MAGRITREIAWTATCPRDALEAVLMDRAAR